jgi:DNA polymerase
VFVTQDRAAALAAIAEQVRACTRCPLYIGTTNPVPGAGNPDAEIMFIGEGPGYHEDQQGLPFVGRSGDYLNSLIKLIGYTRDQVFIANVVKHRPPENRDPLPDEILACKPYLDAQVDLINPLVIATLGRYSMARYFPDGRITRIHGQPKYANGRAYVPLFHPAAVLRNPDLRADMEADFKRIPEILEKARQERAARPAAPTLEEKPPEPPKQLKLF